MVYEVRNLSGLSFDFVMIIHCTLAEQLSLRLISTKRPLIAVHTAILLSGTCCRRSDFLCLSLQHALKFSSER